jgi:starvation-inducible DNA-binding protein
MTMEVMERPETAAFLGIWGGEAAKEIARELRHLLADVFALYLKTKNFHWHMSGVHFRDYHLLLDEHADQIFAMIDPIAERTRKLGSRTLHSISDITLHQSINDNNEEHISSKEMLSELFFDNRQMVTTLLSLYEICDCHHDVATVHLIENWIDETGRRAWFLGEIVQGEGE